MNGQPPAPPDAAPKRSGLPPLAWVAIGCGALVVIGGIVLLLGGMFVAKKVGDVAQDMENNPAAAAAELIVKLNPELELIESDRDAGTMTIRNKQTGETLTADYSQIEQGNFSFDTGEGMTTISADQEAGTVTMSGPDGESTMEFSGDQEGGTVTMRGSDGNEVVWGAGADATDIPSWIPSYPNASDVASTFSQKGADSESGLFTAKVTDDTETVIGWWENELRGQGYEVTTNRMSSNDTFWGTVVGDNGSGRTITVNITREGSADATLAIAYESK
ncbi:MAG: hypothetical protein AAGD38_06940 [Acidobacteriota bacterium]